MSQFENFGLSRQVEEVCDVRFAESDTQTKRQAPAHQEPTTRPKPHHSRKPGAGIPKPIRKDTVQFARSLKHRYPKCFANDADLKNRVARLIRVKLPPRPRKRGRPGIGSVTNAIDLKKKYKRTYPQDTPRQRWQRIYPAVIPNYATMDILQRKDACYELRERVRQRQAKRRRRRRRENSSLKSPSQKPG